jgi:hypothetical protein
MRRTTAIALSLCLIAAIGVAADAKKPLSPATKAEATIDGKKLTIDYSAPSRRDRVIMGGLVPYGKVWRTGANAATTFTTATDVMIGDLRVPAGTYTLFTIPTEKDWTLIVNKQTGQWGTQYDESQDLGRVKMTVKALPKTVETFVIGVNPGKAKSGTLTMAWENTEASVPISIR